VIDAENHTLELRPEAFNMVCGNAVSAHENPVAVLHHAMEIAKVGQLAIAAVLVSIDPCPLLHELLDNGDERCAPRVLHLHGDHVAAPLQHAEHGRLVLVAAAPVVLGLLALVLVLLAAADIRLVALHLSVERLTVILSEQAAGLVQEVPCGLFRNAEVPRQLTGRDALLVRGDEIQSHHPLPQRKVAALKDGPDPHGELVSAALAAVAPVLACLAMVSAAVGADNITVCPPYLCDGITALLLGVEISGERKKVIELCEVDSHGVGSFKLYAKIGEPSGTAKYFQLIKAK